MVVQGLSLLFALLVAVCGFFNKRAGLCWCLGFLKLWTFLYFLGSE